MARKDRTDTSKLIDYAARSTKETERNIHPNSLANLKPNHREKAPTSYMQVNVYGFDDYLYRMARYNKMTTTKYVLSLIRKDAEANAALYENLKALPAFDKPHRESPNRKK